MRRSERMPFIWLSGLSLVVALALIGGMIFLLFWQGVGAFWPRRVAEIVIASPERQEKVLGEVLDRAKNPEVFFEVYLKVGNRDRTGSDFRWVQEDQIQKIDFPPEITVFERMEHGNLYGYFERLSGSPLTLKEAIDRARERRGQSEKIRRGIGKSTWKSQELAAKLEKLRSLEEEDQRIAAVIRLADGEILQVPVSSLVRAYQSNVLKPWQRVHLFISKFASFLVSWPREANTEGGIFPAIFGTVLMVFMMTLAVVPLGVCAAVYLHEYASPSWLVRVLRVAVNNLAGIPSIVFGVFGLGFFVYFVGGSLDQLFFADQLPHPTFGTGGILWAALTLALLTLPVVIVAAEEGLSAVPWTNREAALALSATKFQTIWRVVIPHAFPGILTGVILAISRAAGEVAPLMLTGAIKLAHELGVSGGFPFLHLNRKFMHLGFHIYDVGFQSPNVEAAKPVVYATALVLLLIVLLLNALAIYLRAKIRRKYKMAVV